MQEQNKKTTFTESHIKFIWKSELNDIANDTYIVWAGSSISAEALFTARGRQMRSIYYLYVLQLLRGFYFTSMTLKYYRGEVVGLLIVAFNDVNMS